MRQETNACTAKTAARKLQHKSNSAMKLHIHSLGDKEMAALIMKKMRAQSALLALLLATIAGCNSKVSYAGAVPNLAPKEAILISVIPEHLSEVKVEMRAQYGTLVAGCGNSKGWMEIGSQSIEVTSDDKNQFVVFRDFYQKDQCNWVLDGISILVTEVPSGKLSAISLGANKITESTFSFKCRLDDPPVAGMCRTDSLPGAMADMSVNLTIKYR